MPSLVYALVSSHTPTVFFPYLTGFHVLGVHAPRSRDEHLYAAHRPTAIYNEAQALHLHIGESSYSEATVWHEG